MRVVLSHFFCGLSVLISLLSKLPFEILDIAVELRLFRPAASLEKVADKRLLDWREGTSAVMVLVVALTSVAADKVTLERPLHPAWHVAVETSQADGHADRLAAAM